MWVFNVLKIVLKEDVIGDVNGFKGIELWMFKIKKEGEVFCKVKEEIVVFN